MIIENSLRTVFKAFKWYTTDDEPSGAAFAQILRALKQEMSNSWSANPDETHALNYGYDPDEDFTVGCPAFNLTNFRNSEATSVHDFIQRSYIREFNHFFGDDWMTTRAKMASWMEDDAFGRWRRDPHHDYDGPYATRLAQSPGNFKHFLTNAPTWEFTAQVFSVAYGHSFFTTPVPVLGTGMGWSTERTRLNFFCNGNDDNGHSSNDKNGMCVLTLYDGDMYLPVNISYKQLEPIIEHLESQASLYQDGGNQTAFRGADRQSKLVKSIVKVSVALPDPVVFLCDENTNDHLISLISPGVFFPQVLMAIPLQATSITLIHGGFSNSDCHRIPTDLIQHSIVTATDGEFWENQVTGANRNFATADHSNAKLALDIGPSSMRVFGPAHRSWPAIVLQ